MPKTNAAATSFMKTFWTTWQRVPLYLRILGGLVLGVILGLSLPAMAEVLANTANALGRNATAEATLDAIAAGFAQPSSLIMRLLSALAPPLILFAVMQALMKVEIPARNAARLAGLLLLNTLVAICVGLFVANMIQPGRLTKLDPPDQPGQHAAANDPLSLFLENVPRSIMGPFSDNGKVLGVIFIAMAFGVALRRFRHEPTQNVEQLVDVAMKATLVVLHWIIAFIPLAVMGTVTSTVALEGFGNFIALGGFVLTVLLALALQASYYLVRVKYASWVRPMDLIRGTRDALVMAFSTASSTATMPVTYNCLRENVGLREDSASMGALVGANFNNDGTALYEAMAALFVAQMLNLQLGPAEQLMVVLMSIVASIGAAGIPEAGLVTMTLVFNAVGLPTEYILLLFTVDWFLDRCRTMINVMGDTNVSCVLEGKIRQPAVAS